jgi:hypothetical protein
MELPELLRFDPVPVPVRPHHDGMSTGNRIGFTTANIENIRGPDADLPAPRQALMRAAC